jgi:hypothetical protein
MATLVPDGMLHSWGQKDTPPDSKGQAKAHLRTRKSKKIKYQHIWKFGQSLRPTQHFFILRKRE